MTIYGRKINNEDMANIATYMDDDIREQLHFELAPCTNEEFIARYLELDPEFEDLLENEFEFDRSGISKDDIAEQLQDFVNDMCLEYMEDTGTNRDEIERRLSVEDVAGTVDELAEVLARIFR